MIRRASWGGLSNRGWLPRFTPRLHGSADRLAPPSLTKWYMPNGKNLSLWPGYFLALLSVACGATLRREGHGPWVRVAGTICAMFVLCLASGRIAATPSTPDAQATDRVREARTPTPGLLFLFPYRGTPLPPGQFLDSPGLSGLRKQGSEPHEDPNFHICYRDGACFYWPCACRGRFQCKD